MSNQSNHHAEVLKQDDFVSIGNCDDYINIADLGEIPELPDLIDEAVKALGAEMSYRMAASIDALMLATNGSELPYIYREPVPTQNLRLTNITVPDIPAAPVAKRAALVMAVLETRRRFLEELFGRNHTH